MLLQLSYRVHASRRIVVEFVVVIQLVVVIHSLLEALKSRLYVGQLPALMMLFSLDSTKGIAEVEAARAAELAGRLRWQCGLARRSRWPRRGGEL